MLQLAKYINKNVKLSNERKLSFAERLPSLATVEFDYISSAVI